MVRLIAKNITHDFITSHGGLAIGYDVESILTSDPSENIEISFYDVPFISPSFVNGAFLYLIDNYGEDFFKRHVKVIQASPEVAKTISTSVRNYIEHQKSFYEKLKTNSIFLAGDNSFQTKELLEALIHAAEEKGVVYAVNSTPDLFTLETQHKIQDADVFIGILTGSNVLPLFEQQLKFAIEQKKACLLLQSKSVEHRLPTASFNKVQVIYYDQSNPVDALKKLNEIIQRYKRETEVSMQPYAENENQWIVALAALLITVVLAAVVFSNISSDQNNKKPS